MARSSEALNSEFDTNKAGATAAASKASAGRTTKKAEASASGGVPKRTTSDPAVVRRTQSLASTGNDTAPDPTNCANPPGTPSIPEEAVTATLTPDPATVASPNLTTTSESPSLPRPYMVHGIDIAQHVPPHLLVLIRNRDGPFWSPLLDTVLKNRTPQFTPRYIFFLLGFRPVAQPIKIYYGLVSSDPARRLLHLLSLIQTYSESLDTTLKRINSTLGAMSRVPYTGEIYDQTMRKLLKDGDDIVEMIAELAEMFLKEVKHPDIVLSDWDRVRFCVMWRVIETACENYRRAVKAVLFKRYATTTATWGWRWELTGICVAVALVAWRFSVVRTLSEGL